MQYIQQPQAIEAKSFDIISEIIAETRPDYRFASPLHEAIIKRVIHTTADFDWLDILWFSPDALIALSEALSRPCTLYTDTTMALSGINKTLLARFGGECRCYISDPRVVREAQSRGMTRSMVAVDIAVQEPGEKVFVFGNAPTALFRLLGKGSFNIVPDFAYDDGRFTFVGFSPSKSIPSVTKELNGKEHVVNSSIQKKGDFTVLVIQEVTPRLVLRSGNAVVGLENSGFGKVHAADGSTVSRQVERVEKPESN